MKMFKKGILVAAMSIAAAGCLPPKSQVIEFEAYVDGRSQLHIKGNQLWWHHFEFSAPGLWPHGPEPAPLPTRVNGTNWLPEWPTEGDNSFCDCDSSKLAGKFAAFDQNIVVEVISARGPVTVVQQILDTSELEAVIEFDDYYEGGAEWYKVRITQAPAEG